MVCLFGASAEMQSIVVKQGLTQMPYIHTVGCEAVQETRNAPTSPADSCM
uniref:Uncharacterized protein n=1 Tax=Anguilla anguilla TaxID=7936 RepID=A0A0E9QFD4_ANGAN